MPGTYHSGPLIGLKLQAQCALASRKQCGVDQVVAKNIAKYSNDVVIIAINNSVTWEGV